jgi:hypothetical protein
MGDVNLGRGGAVGTVLATVGDLVLNSGEFVAAAFGWIVSNADLLLPMFSTLRGQIAPEVEWLPTAPLDKLVFGLGVLFVLILGYRLLKRTFGDSS